MDDGQPLSARIPAATYRVQLNRLFGFRDARETVPYLSDLGITDLYTSPFFKAMPGSLHGYDVTDPTMLNPEIGTEEEYAALSEELRERSMGQIVDIVPNHMCLFHEDNIWWMDVLENGPSSPYAAFFDVDWHPVATDLHNRVLLPLLGDQYGKVIEAQELRLAFEEGAFFVRCYDYRFPVLPETYPYVLGHVLGLLANGLGPESPVFAEFRAMAESFRRIPRYTITQPAKMAERREGVERAKSRLRELYDGHEAVRNSVDRSLRLFNGEKGVPRSFDLLDGLLRRQIYRLSFWKVAAEEINYRRFFDVNSLGAVRMENTLVFRFFHRLVLRFIREGRITGLRVDHPDGLFDPAAYFADLQKSCFLALQKSLTDDVARQVNLNYDGRYITDEATRRYEAVRASEPHYKPFYIVGEKILVKSERMPEEWPIFSTTGYVFLNSLNGIFVDARSARAFDHIYGQFIRSPMNYQDIVYESRKLIMHSAMSGEINTLGRYLATLSKRNRHTRDFTRNNLTDALVEVIACFPVYRTYTNTFETKERDRQYIEAALSRARRRNPEVGPEVYDFVHDVLLLRFPPSSTEREKKEWCVFVMKFQQITSPVMAKGIEDTAFYRYNRLISLNDVGGNPEKFGTTLETFHGQNIERAKYWPHALIATSTHDSKIGEDAKARINVLSETHDQWKDCLHYWHQLNRKKKIIVDGQAVPDKNEEYRLYQVLLGTWPDDLLPEDTAFGGYAKRIRNHVIKAAREAKTNTSWINPNSLYEEALALFVETLLTPGPANRFLHDFRRFQEVLSCYGMNNALSQVLLKMTAPGVPDFYQGTEFWYYRLVDPDNREPIDFAPRVAALADLKDEEGRGGLAAICRNLLETRRDGRIKLYVIHKTLTFRKEHRAIFDEGDYLPLEAGGSEASHICSFARRSAGSGVIVCAPRLSATLVRDPAQPPIGRDVWNDTVLYVPIGDPGSIYRNIFTGKKFEMTDRSGSPALDLSDVLEDFPVALLERLP
jgi:(1->4)-alpha-D-glucan 1-alpha-D-glucosylmutase